MSKVTASMPKIIVSADCGNSPKKLFLKECNVAFAEGDISFIIDNVSDDITWNIVGDKFIQGKNDFAEALKDMKNKAVVELTIHNIITHGKEGAVNGTLILENEEQYAYCDVYQFSGAKGANLKSIQSYVIEIKR